jgi:hypothetical protein
MLQPGEDFPSEGIYGASASSTPTYGLTSVTSTSVPSAAEETRKGGVLLGLAIIAAGVLLVALILAYFFFTSCKKMRKNGISEESEECQPAMMQERMSQSSYGSQEELSPGWYLRQFFPHQSVLEADEPDGLDEPEIAPLELPARTNDAY